MSDDKLRDKALEWAMLRPRVGATSTYDMMADFAAECVSAERERVADEIERITNGSSCELNLLIQQLRTSNGEIELNLLIQQLRTSNDEIERITNGSSCELNLLIQQLRTSK